MPSLFIYLIKVNASLVLFYLAYRFLLRPLTFYYLNRFFLLFALSFSTIYPFIDLSSFFRHNPAITGRLVVIVPDWQRSTATLTPVPRFPADQLWPVLELAFWLGVSLFALRLIIRLISLYRMHRCSKPASWKNYQFRITKEDISPFSFMRSIYVNEKALEARELESVLSHEQVHAAELHTADVLLSELNTIFYWFNPGAWLMKNAVKENLEFITDRKVLLSGVDSTSYQYSLIKVVSSGHRAAIVNHFNLITLKNRIVMMNKKRSSSIQAAKYVVLPAMIILVMVFTVSKAQLERTGRSVLSALRSTSLATLASGTTGQSQTADNRIRPAGQLNVAGAVSVSVLGSSDIRLDVPEMELPQLILTADTSYYNVDGKMVNSIQNIIPEDIALVQVLGKEQASKVFGTDYPKGVVIVFTRANRGSEAVLSLQKKLRETGVTQLSGLTSVSVASRPSGGRGGYLVKDSTYAAANGSDVTTIRRGTVTGDVRDVIFDRRTGEAQRSIGGVIVEDISFDRIGKITEGVPVTAIKVNGKVIDVRDLPAAKSGETTTILLDGKHISEEELKKIAPKDIKQFSVTKGVLQIKTKD